MSVIGGAFALCGLVLLGCAMTQMGATPADLARAQDQAAPGATTYAKECATCHGNRGEGLATAPALLGPGTLPEQPRNAGGSGNPTLTDPQQMQLEDAVATGGRGVARPVPQRPGSVQFH